MAVAAPPIEKVYHRAGPCERERADTPTGQVIVQRCLRCDLNLLPYATVERGCRRPWALGARVKIQARRCPQVLGSGE